MLFSTASLFQLHGSAKNLSHSTMVALWRRRTSSQLQIMNLSELTLALYQKPSYYEHACLNLMSACTSSFQTFVGSG